MKNKKILLAAAVAVSLLSACSKEEPDSNKEIAQSDVLSISTSINQVYSRSNSGFTGKDPGAFANNDEIGLFLYKSSGWGEAYPRFESQNNKSTMTSDGWKQATPIYLLHDEAKIWAYYPYSSTVTNGQKIPVSISSSKHVDYLWGESENTVSVIQTDAIIPMKHALAQFVIRLKVSPDYHNDGILSSAKLIATSTKFGTSGTMDISNKGKITFTGNSKELSWNVGTTIPSQGSDPADFSAAIFPMEIAQNEVTLEVVIDDATYHYTIPQTSWEAGNRYIYSIEMHSNSAEIGGENGQSVTIEPWESTDSDITLVPVK